MEGLGCMVLETLGTLGVYLGLRNIVVHSFFLMVYKLFYFIFLGNFYLKFYFKNKKYIEFYILF
jgi:hypothetical protein